MWQFSSQSVLCVCRECLWVWLGCGWGVVGVRVGGGGCLGTGWGVEGAWHRRHANPFCVLCAVNQMFVYRPTRSSCWTLARGHPVPTTWGDADTSHPSTSPCPCPCPCPCHRIRIRTASSAPCDVLCWWGGWRCTLSGQCVAGGGGWQWLGAHGRCGPGGAGSVRADSWGLHVRQRVSARWWL